MQYLNIVIFSVKAKHDLAFGIWTCECPNTHSWDQLSLEGELSASNVDHFIQQLKHSCHTDCKQ